MIAEDYEEACQLLGQAVAGADIAEVQFTFAHAPFRELPQVFVSVGSSL
jgi:hypothetical protein